MSPNPLHTYTHNSNFYIVSLAKVYFLSPDLSKYVFVPRATFKIIWNDKILSFGNWLSFCFISFRIQMLSSTCLQCCICTDADLVSGWRLWVAAFEKLDDNTTPHPSKHKRKHLFIHFIFTIFSFPPVFLVCTHAGDSSINVQLHFSLIKHT